MGVQAFRAGSLGSGAAAADPGLVSLLALARARPELAWPAGADIANAHNAHYTNTLAQMAAALMGDHNWLEGDVALIDGTPVMRHDGRQRVELTLEQWLQVAAASGRGAKVEVKDRAALPQVLELVRRSGIPQHRLIFNIGPGPASNLLLIRQHFRDAIINVAPEADAHLTSADIVQLQVAARIAGGRIMFPLRIDTVDEAVVAALRPLGRVAIWNSPELWIPREDDVQRLRAMGVDGMIDLRDAANAWQRIQAAAVAGATHVFGWDAVHTALDAVGWL